MLSGSFLHSCSVHCPCHTHCCCSIVESRLAYVIVSTTKTLTGDAFATFTFGLLNFAKFTHSFVNSDATVTATASTSDVIVLEVVVQARFTNAIVKFELVKEQVASL